MNCYHCNNKLIWGGDHTFEDYGHDGDGIVSNLHCTKCPTSVLVFNESGKENNGRANN